MHENETEGRKRFHMNSFARRPILTVQKQKATRKWCTSTGVPMTNAKNTSLWAELYETRPTSSSKYRTTRKHIQP